MANIRIKDLTNEAASFDDDHFVELDGLTNGSKKMRLGRIISAGRNALAPRGGVAFDGSGATVSAVLTNQNIGSDPFSLSIVFRVPSSAAYGSTSSVAALSSQVANAGVQANSFSIDPWTDGNLRIVLYGTTTADKRTAVVANFFTNYGGKVVHVLVVRGATGLVIYINGVAQTFTEETSGTPPAWATWSIASTYLVSGTYNSSSMPGAVYALSLYNLALSASDVLEIYELNGSVPERFKWGTQVNLSNSNPTQAGGQIWKGSNWSTFTVAPTTATLVGTNAVARTQAAFALAFGQQVRIRASVTVNSGGLDLCLNLHQTGTALLGSGNGISATGSVDKTITNTSSGTSDAVGVIATADASGNAFDGSYTVLTLTKLGALVHLPLDDGYSYLLKDQSSNKLHAVMTTSGVAHLVQNFRPHHIRGTTNTNGNQQLQGAVLIPANSQILRVRARAQSNTPTITIGTSSGGSQIVASVALSTTWKDLTIALTGGIVSADTSIWIGSNSTDVVEIDIDAEPLSP